MTDKHKRGLALGELRLHRDEIISMADKYGAYNVRVFGSVARGEALAGSDVDILVSARPGVSVFDLVELWLDLQDLLGLEVSLVTDDENPRREAFMQRVKQDAISL